MRVLAGTVAAISILVAVALPVHATPRETTTPQLTTVEPRYVDIASLSVSMKEDGNSVTGAVNYHVSKDIRSTVTIYLQRSTDGRAFKNYVQLGSQSRSRRGEYAFSRSKKNLDMSYTYRIKAVIKIKDSSGNVIEEGIAYSDD